MLIEDTIFTSPTEEGTAPFYGGHPSEGLAVCRVEMQYPSFAVMFSP